jgi:hypothetical protein
MFPGSLAPTNQQRTLSINVGPGPSTTGPNYGQPTYHLGAMDVPFRAFKNQYAQGFPSNNSIMLPYAIKPKLPVEERMADIGMNELVFVRVGEMSRNTQPYPDYQFRTLSRLNQHLASPECRHRYGSSKSVEPLLKDWQLFCVPQRDPYNYGSSSELGAGSTPMPENVMTMIVGMRARLWNIWTAAGVGVRPGNRVWVIPRRHEYHPLVPRSADGSDSSSFLPAEKEFVWRMEPYVTTSAADPPLDLYWNLRFQSKPLYVGFVTELYGKMDNQIEDYFYRALRAVFPDDAGEKYRETLHQLNEIVIFFGMR